MLRFSIPPALVLHFFLALVAYLFPALTTSGGRIR